MNRFDHNLEPDAFVSRLGPLTSAGPAVSGMGRPTAHHANTGLPGWSGRLADTLSTWDRRRRYRRELEQMDEHLLADIGLTPGVARLEAEKPFWRA